jgi:glycosyltransferase involved in cell wall biosynthesis
VVGLGFMSGFISTLSVLMSIYHKEERTNLRECLKSLSIQSKLASEIILVEDGLLTPALYEEIEIWEKKLPIIRVKLPKNIGLGKALNEGLTYCSNELVARMDTDDICLPQRFEKQLLIFENNKDVSICGTSILEFDTDPTNTISSRIPPLSQKDILKFSCWKNPFNHMTVMFKKSHIIHAGSYQDLPWMEDWFLWLRLLALGYKGQNISEPLVNARTGVSMIVRRSGASYVKSEWALTVKKIELKLVSRPKAYMIFCLRSIPRLLPKRTLFKLYIFFRKVK